MNKEPENAQPVRANLPKQPGAKGSPYASVDDNRPSGDWSLIETNAEDLRLLVAGVLAAGDAVMFSCARKGTAYAVTIYHDGVPVKKWASDLEAFEEIVSLFTRIALQQLPQEIAKRFTT